MDFLLLIVAGLVIGGATRSFLPFDGRRGLVVVIVMALLFIGYSPAAEGSGAPGTVLALSVGLLATSVLGGRPGGAAPSPAVLVFASAYFLLAAAVTFANIRAGFVTLLEFAVLAIGTLISARRGTAADRRTIRRGIVGIAVAEALAACWELLVLGRPGFWDYTKTSDDAAGLDLSNPLTGDTVARMAGTTGHPIVLGLLLAAAIAIVVTTPRDIGRGIPRWMLFVVLAAGQFAAGTRSALIASLIAGAFAIATSSASSRGLRVAAAVVGGGFGLVQATAFLSAQTAALLDSGSWINRSGNIGEAPELVTGRPPLEALFGSGWGSESSLFARGFLYQNGFGIIDNQLVTTLATFGVVGLVLLLGLLLSAWRRGSRTTRAVLLVVVCMAFSFDFMRWAGVVVLLFAVIADERRPAPAAAQPSEHAPHDLHPHPIDSIGAHS